jgi:hypothetical protein
MSMLSTHLLMTLVELIMDLLIFLMASALCMRWQTASILDTNVRDNTRRRRYRARTRARTYLDARRTRLSCCVLCLIAFSPCMRAMSFRRSCSACATRCQTPRALHPRARAARAGNDAACAPIARIRTTRTFFTSFSSRFSSFSALAACRCSCVAASCP